MEVSFEVSTKIAKPANLVFQAVTNAEMICEYFTSTSSGDIEKGEDITWTWGLQEEVIHVKEVQGNFKIVFNWRAWKTDYDTEVKIYFEPMMDGTRVIIQESGWQENQQGLDSSYEHCAGWQHFLLCLKAWMLHKIDLR